MQNTESINLPAATVARIVAAVANIPGTRFAGVTYRSKESGELARHVILLGADYGNTVTASLEKLSANGGANLTADVAQTKALQASVANTDKGTAARKRANDALKAFQNSIGAERAACAELFISLVNTLVAGVTGEQNPAYTKQGLYDKVCDGITVSRADGSLELHGMSISRVVLEPGTYPVVNSSAKTIAKEKLRRDLPIGKYRTLALDDGAMQSLRIAGNEIDCMN